MVQDYGLAILARVAQSRYFFFLVLENYLQRLNSNQSSLAFLIPQDDKRFPELVKDELSKSGHLLDARSSLSEKIYMFGSVSIYSPQSSGTAESRTIILRS